MIHFIYSICVLAAYIYGTGWQKRKDQRELKREWQRMPKIPKNYLITIKTPKT